MFSLSLFLLFFLAFDNSGQDETIESLEDRILTHLNSYYTTKDILTGIYNGPITPKFRSLLHLSLNNLLISNEVLASTDPDGSSGLQQAADNIQQENEKLLNLLGSQQERDKYKQEYASLSNEIATAVNQKYDTQFEGGFVATENVKESIASLLTLDEVHTPLRVHTFNTLLHRFLRGARVIRT